MYSKKEKLDKFYTKKEVAKECIKLLNLEEYATVIEPSAGSGAFSSQITHSNLIALDLSPESDYILKMDWFKFKHEKKGKTLVIGNPPFGLRNKLSQLFIAKALTLADTIAFILPNVYNKHTLQSVFPKGWRLKEVKKLERDSFVLNGKPYHVPCSFYIFDKSEGKNLMFDIAKYKTCKDFIFCVGKDKINADVFILGASPSKIKELSEVTPSNRGYYLKATGITKQELVKKIKETNWIGNSSANGGVSWLTKPEIIKCYKESNNV